MYSLADACGGHFRAKRVADSERYGAPRVFALAAQQPPRSI